MFNKRNRSDLFLITKFIFVFTILIKGLIIFVWQFTKTFLTLRYQMISVLFFIIFVVRRYKHIIFNIKHNRTIVFHLILHYLFYIVFRFVVICRSIICRTISRNIFNISNIDIMYYISSIFSWFFDRMISFFDYERIKEINFVFVLDGQIILSYLSKRITKIWLN